MTVKFFRFASLFLLIVISIGCDQKNKSTVQEEATNDPAVLYRSVGIKECGYDFVWKGEHLGGVLLEGDDLNRALDLLKPHYGERVNVVLYTNAPEASEKEPGQPALLALNFNRDSGKYCALGVSASYSVPIFLEFQKKYQGQLK